MRTYIGMQPEVIQQRQTNYSELLDEEDGDSEVHGPDRRNEDFFFNWSNLAPQSMLNTHHTDEMPLSVDETTTDIPIIPPISETCGSSAIAGNVNGATATSFEGEIMLNYITNSTKCIKVMKLHNFCLFIFSVLKPLDEMSWNLRLSPTDSNASIETTPTERTTAKRNTAKQQHSTEQAVFAKNWKSVPHPFEQREELDYEGSTPSNSPFPKSDIEEMDIATFGPFVDDPPAHPPATSSTPGKKLIKFTG